MRRQEIRMDERTVLYLDNIDNEKCDYVKLETEISDDEPINETKREMLKTLESLGASDVVRISYGEN